MNFSDCRPVRFYSAGSRFTIPALLLRVSTETSAWSERQKCKQPKIKTRKRNKKLLSNKDKDKKEKASEESVDTSMGLYIYPGLWSSLLPLAIIIEV